VPLQVSPSSKATQSESSKHWHEFGPPPQAPSTQASPLVQTLPSSQAAVFGVFTQPNFGSHESSVHGLLSSHAPALGVKTHPFAGSQELPVQATLSLHCTICPDPQKPPAHVSNTVQALPSEQRTEFAVKTQPVAGSQASSVQPLPSSQEIATTPTQTLSEHVSAPVQAEPSSHATEFGLKTQPLSASHTSVVQTLPSSQNPGSTSV